MRPVTQLQSSLKHFLRRLFSSAMQKDNLTKSAEEEMTKPETQLRVECGAD